jgi:predicted adenylyl cyclase CyaB
MKHLNVEIKARCAEQDRVRAVLRSSGAHFKGTDRQVDTYFKVATGRLKLREGLIENFLVFYEREDREGPKESRVILFESEPGSALKEILVRSLGVLVIVDKTREIYFIDNVKFHIDLVQRLGAFVEIEAIDADGTIGKSTLRDQCERYLKLLDIDERNLVTSSYSDLLLRK